MADFSNKVVYQIYPKSFRDTNGDGFGDIPGVIEKLDYLQELGVDYLWLTPFFPSPQHDNGYDVADYCADDPKFGTMEDLEELIRQSEARGMGLIIPPLNTHGFSRLWQGMRPIRSIIYSRTAGRTAFPQTGSQNSAARLGNMYPPLKNGISGYTM